MNKIQKTFELRKGHHIVHGRRKSDGFYEIIAPKIFLREKKLLFVRYKDIEQDKILTREEAVFIAQEAIKSNKYQDVLVLRDNGFFEELVFPPTVIFENGQWTDYIIYYNSAVAAFNANKNATVIEIKKKKIRKKGFLFKCLNFISSFNKKKKRRVRKKKVINNDKK